jgi:hypothetical protein
LGAVVELVDMIHHELRAINRWRPSPYHASGT